MNTFFLLHSNSSAYRHKPSRCKTPAGAGLIAQWLVAPKSLIIAALAVLLVNSLFAQSTTGSASRLTQTVRGTIRDADSKRPLPGVTVLILQSTPTLGTITGTDGTFRIPHVPVGRVSLALSFMGYQKRTVPNVMVNSGKETVLNLDLLESAVDLDEAVVKAFATNGEPTNEMAQVSARSISTEEMSRLTASFNDPAMITSSFAGVANSGNGGNDIIVRGNSPKYLQWRLEGMPITNPNHFADQSAVLGSTSALNANVLATSDFYTGAFPPEFGNAISGIYDLRLRTGNNQKFESILGVGLIGTDLTLEGPFKKGYDGSFLVNYRYSTASMLNKAGLLDVPGNPTFQDAAFKLNLPTEKLGTFSLFGLGGASRFALENATPEDWDTPGDDVMGGTFFEDYDKASRLLNTGLNHILPLDGSSYLESSLSYSAEEVDDDVFRKTDSTGVGVPSFVSALKKATYRAAVHYNRKIEARMTVRVGANYSIFQQAFRQGRRFAADPALVNLLDFDQRIGVLRNYVSWKRRLSETTTVVAGLHNTHVFYNHKHSAEPRISVSWKPDARNTFSAGYGLHSTMESVHHYFAKIRQDDGGYTQPNKDLDLLKAHHFVVGYDHHFTPNLVGKVEAYYQHLYNLPVASDSSYFATINEGADISYHDLVNQGTGTNYGIELTLQRFLANNYFFLLNTSFYQSKYKALDGVDRNTRFNGNYLVNLIGGKEFVNLGRNKNKTLGINAKVFVGGGQKVIPLLRDEQGNLAVDPANNKYWEYGKAYDHSLENIYQITLSASFKIERKSTTHELFVNLENITDNKGKLTEYYDAKAPGKVGHTTQFGLLPNLMYRLYF